MLAELLNVEHVSKKTDLMFHFSDAKPALMNGLILFLLLISGKLNSKLFNNTISTILILNNAVPSQYL